jgi:tricorn protease
MVIERLSRQLVMFEKGRNSSVKTNPHEMLLGPKVLLVNQDTMSDGEIFAYRFQVNGVGKVIGTRTWGGDVGTRNSLPLVDGGFLTKPEFGQFSRDGRSWVIEDHGVEPDIVVVNDPAREFGGIDQQLRGAVAEVVEELNSQARPPEPPRWPDRR